MTTRSLKWLTSGFIVAGVLVTLSMPVVLGKPPRKGSPVRESRAYAVRGLAATGILLVTVIGAGVGAFLLVRRARDEYREESMANMRALLEQTREDQLKKAAGESTED